MTMDKLLQGKRRLEAINNKESNTRIVGGTFEDRHKRVTLYLELPLFEEIQELRLEGKISNMTRFVNTALRYYLDEEFV